MAYTLRIGELETTVNYEGLESRILNCVLAENHKTAPAYGEPTDYSNSRWPSYSI